MLAMMPNLQTVNRWKSVNKAADRLIAYISGDLASCHGDAAQPPESALALAPDRNL
jgi:hypothetical protein